LSKGEEFEPLSEAPEAFRLHRDGGEEGIGSEDWLYRLVATAALEMCGCAGGRKVCTGGTMAATRAITSISDGAVGCASVDTRIEGGSSCVEASGRWLGSELELDSEA